jgi:hypothetical protein
MPDSHKAADLRAQGHQVPDGRFPLFVVDVESVSLLVPAGDHLDIRWWNERDGARQVDRY